MQHFYTEIKVQITNIIIINLYLFFKKKLSPILCVIIFYEKIFLGFLFGSTSGTLKQYSTLKQEDKMFLWGMTFWWRQVKFVKMKGRRKVEGRQKYFVDEKKNTFLNALWSGTLSLTFIEVYFHY